MKNEAIKNRDEWRALNLKIAQHQRVIKINSAAGQIFSDDYLNWLNDLINRRNYLTTNGGF
jgi:hypothetical protein